MPNHGDHRPVFVIDSCEIGVEVRGVDGRPFMVVGAACIHSEAAGERYCSHCGWSPDEVPFCIGCHRFWGDGFTPP